MHQHPTLREQVRDHLAQASSPQVHELLTEVAATYREYDEALATARRHTEQAQALAARLREALDSTADGVLVLDAEAQVTDFNRRFAELWFLDATTAEKSEVLHLVREQLVRPATFTEILKAHATGRDAPASRRFETKDGRVFDLLATRSSYDGEPTGCVFSFRDVTETVESERTLEFFAYHDSLTNLPNRRMFVDRLEQAIAQSRRIGTRALVAFVDLDRFKTINDSLGHQVGDQFLQEVAARLMKRTRTEDTVARLAGDEFALLVNNVNSQRAIDVIARGIQEVLEPAVELQGHRLDINASVGMALFPDDATEAEDLLSKADAAMYAAKAHGGATYRLFQESMHRESLQRLRLENELRAAIRARNLLVHYQPQVSLADGHITGVEALVRWDRNGQIVYPGDFIGVAEESGLIRSLGDFVLHQASLEATRAVYARDHQLRVAVNISALQLRDPGFVRQIARALETSGLTPRHLEVELTESCIMGQPEESIRMFHQLREMGVKIAIDDFGTGYSSFSHLKELPITKIKIDRSFVTRCGEDRSNQAILRSLVSMAHHLGLQVIAEGVETEAEAAFLRSCDCNEAQGYLFGRPMSIEDLHLRLREATARLPA